MPKLFQVHEQVRMEMKTRHAHSNPTEDSPWLFMNSFIFRLKKRYSKVTSSCLPSLLRRFQLLHTAKLQKPVVLRHPPMSHYHKVCYVLCYVV